MRVQPRNALSRLQLVVIPRSFIFSTSSLHTSFVPPSEGASLCSEGINRAPGTRDLADGGTRRSSVVARIVDERFSRRGAENRWRGLRRGGGES